MPIYKNLPRERPRAKDLPFYRPIDRLFLNLWERRRSLAPFLTAAAVLLLTGLGLRIYSNSRETRSRVAALAGMKLGSEDLKGGRYDEAISRYQPVASGSSNPPVLRVAALQNLSLAYAKKGDWTNAVAFMERAIADRGNSAADWSRFLLAKIFEMKGDKGKAEEIYKSIAEGTAIPGLQEEAREKLASWDKEQEKK